MEKESCILNQEFVNKFADFLCQEISENNTYKTKLSVVDCNSLFIIKGYTKMYLLTWMLCTNGLKLSA